MRFNVKKIAVIGGALVLIGGVALGVAASYVNSAAFRARVLDALNGTIKGRVTCGDHHLALISGRIVLSDIAVTAPDGNPVALIRHLRIGLFWPALAWRTLHISSLTIDQADVTLIQDQQDHLNMVQAFEPKAPKATPAPQAKTSSSPWQLRLDNLRVRQTMFSYQRPAQGLAVSAQQIVAAGAGNLLQRAGQLRLEIGVLAIKAGQVDERLDQVTIAAHYDDRNDRPIALNLTALDSRVSVKGRIEQTTPSLQVNAACDLDLAMARINGWLPQVKDLTGRLKGRATLQGPLDDPRATLKLTVTDGGAAGILFQTLNLDAALDQRKIALSDLVLLSPWGDLKLTGRLDLQPVFPQKFSKAEANWDQAAYALDMQCSALKPDRIPLLSLPVQGTWQGRVHLDGAGFSLDQSRANLNAALAVHGFQTAEAAQSAGGELTIEAQWHDQILAVEKLHTSLGATELQAKGQLDWKKKAAAIDGVLGSRQLSELGALIGISLPDGRATLKISGQGPWQRPTARATLKADDLSMAGWTFGGLTAEAVLGKDGVVTVSRLALDNNGGRLAGQGRLTLFGSDGRLHSDPGLNVSLDATQLRLADFTHLSPVNLALNGRLMISGPLLHPAATLNLDDAMLHYHDVSCQASGAARWNDGFLEISNLRFSQGQSAVDLNATASWRDTQTRRWTADPEVSADLNADTIMLEDFVSGAVGAITARANLQGSVSALKGRFQLNGVDLGTSTQIFAAADIEGHLTDNTVHVDHLAVTLAPDQQVRGNGWYALDQRFQFAMQASNLELRQMAALQQQDSIDGRLDLDINAAGTIAHPQMTASLVLRAPTFNENAFDDFKLNLQLQDQLLTAAADLNFKLTGHYRLDSGAFDLNADFDKSDLTAFLSLALKGQWAASLSGDLRAEGNWHTPTDILADVALSDGRLTYEEVDLLSMSQLTGHLEKGHVHLPPTTLQLMQQGHLILAAEGDLEKDLAIRLDGRLPLAVLAPFTDAIERPRGELQIEAHASGPWNQLQWRADLTAANLGGVLTDMGQSLHDLNGRMQFTPDQVRIEKLAGMLDDGHFSLDGQVRLTDGRPRQGAIVFKAQSLPLQLPDTMDMKISADLTLKGDIQKAALEGRIVLLEGAYYKRLKYNLLSAISQPQRTKPVVSTRTAPKWMGAINLNVVIVHRYPFLVDNNMARLEIVPDLKLTGTAANPIVSGRAQVSEGEVFFRGKTFTVQQGVVDFVNPYKIEPTMDIVAQTQVRQWTIKLGVSGTPDNLMIHLSSDPSESDANILTLILLGRTSGELSRNNAEGGANTGQMLAALAASTWGEDIKKSTGVDILEVGTSTSADNGTAGGTQITVGKQLTRRLTIKYEVASGSDQMVQRAVSEYRLLENILASGFQDTAGQYGGELLFRIEFR